MTTTELSAGSTQETERLTSLIAGSINISPENPNFEGLRVRVIGLGPHAIHQALMIVEAHPEADLRSAVSDLMSRDDTDGISFLGIESWTHEKLKQTLRLVGGNKRYWYRDMLQAPAKILAEARTLLGITNLCLSGDIYDGSENVADTRDGWALSSDALISLVQRHPDHGDEILRIMTEDNTDDAVLIESKLASTRPLLDGVL